MAANELVVKLEQAVQAAIALDAPLNERMAVIANAVRSLSTVFAEAVDRMVQRLHDQSAGATAPAPGDPMPAFLLPDENGRLVGLAEILQKGPAAIAFQRGHWCPYCRLNAIAMAEVENEIAELGGQVVAIVPERRKFTTALKNEAVANFPFLTDMDNGYALSLNLAIWVGAEMEALIGGAGWDVPSYQGNAAWILPIPATFVVDTDGIIVARYLDPDYRQRMEIDDLLAAIKRAREPRKATSQLRAAS
jgi:peroxiredoxin